MKKYLIFAGSCYYPGGGWEDYIGTSDDLAEARQIVENSNNDWWQIVDTTTMKDIVDD